MTPGAPYPPARRPDPAPVPPVQLPHGHWVFDDQHGQVWCDDPGCDPLADDQHPHWLARQAHLERTTPAEELGR